jgi:hypothetical protein
MGFCTTRPAGEFTSNSQGGRRGRANEEGKTLGKLQRRGAFTPSDDPGGGAGCTLG